MQFKLLGISAFLLASSVSYAATFVMIESEPGDPVGRGESVTLDTVTIPFAQAPEYAIFDAGDYRLRFTAAPVDFNPGTYDNAGYPFERGVEPGMEISWSSRYCGPKLGKFIVHEFERGTDGSILKAAIDFKQHCYYQELPALYGFIRWNSGFPIPDSDGDQVTDVKDNCIDTVNPDQSDSDGDGVGNACDEVQEGTFIHLVSEPGDFVGAGQTYLFTPGAGDPVYPVRDENPGYAWLLAGGFRYDFEALATEALEVGNYEGATEYPFNQPTEPGLRVSGNGRACNQLTGSFEVLEIARDIEGYIQRFAVDFEQRCLEWGEEEPALIGKIRYNALDTDFSEFDSDDDRVIDAVDNCPHFPNGDQINTDVESDGGDACDTDDDNDDWFDVDDNCPLIFNPNQEDVDEDGIGDVCDLPPCSGCGCPA
jgi:hypothetical protein